LQIGSRLVTRASFSLVIAANDVSNTLPNETCFSQSDEQR
jgi:hypothetical protein